MIPELDEEDDGDDADDNSHNPIDDNIDDDENGYSEKKNETIIKTIFFKTKKVMAPEERFFS